MYITNKDGLKVYNVYKFYFLKYLYSNYAGDSFYTSLLNEYNIQVKSENIFDMVGSFSTIKSSYLELINSIKDLKKRNGNEIFLHISKNIKSIDNNTEKLYDDKVVYGFSNFIIEEVLDDGGLVVTNNSGCRYVIEYKDLLSIDENGYQIEIKINALNINDIHLNLYDDINIESNQYGGNQKTFIKSSSLLDDSYVEKNLKSYFPNETSNDYETYISNFDTIGCGYVSMINSIFNEYIGREKEFEDKFGFPMSQSKGSGKIDFNYEYLILDYYNYLNTNLGNDIGNVSIDDFGNLIGNKTYKQETGFTNYSYASFQKYLKDRYNIDIELNEKYLKSETNQSFVTEDNSFDYNQILNAYNDLKTDDNSVVIGSDSFDLYLYDDYIKHGRLSKKAVENCGGHCMTATGVTEDGNLIVSSWGKKYVLDIKSLKNNNGNIDVHSINFKK